MKISVPGRLLLKPARGAVALLAALVPLIGQAQLAPTITVYALLKESATTPFASDFAAAARNDTALLKRLGEPLRIEPASALPPLPESPAVDRKNLAAPDAVVRRWLALTYTVPAGSRERQQDRLRATGLFEAIDQPRAYQQSFTISDPLYSYNTGTPNTHQWGAKELKLQDAFAWTRGRVLIGALDSGLPGLFTSAGSAPTSPVHNDLEPNVRRHLSYQMYNVPSSTGRDCGQPIGLGVTYTLHTGASSEDYQPGIYHGTHVAGIMAGVVNNGIGVSGACPGCSFLMMRSVLGNNGSSGTERQCLNYGLDYAVSNGVSVANFSFGRTSSEPAGSISLDTTHLNLAADHDVVMTASSGNDLDDAIDFPAVHAPVIAVGAIDHQLRLWDERNNLSHPGTVALGSTRCNTLPKEECGSNYGAELSLVAPGAQVLSTITVAQSIGSPGSPLQQAPCSSLTDPQGNNQYGVCTGTSMSSPYVAGIAGLVRSANPLLAWDAVESILRSTARTNFVSYSATTMGSGLPQAENAVKKTLGTVAAAPVFNRLTPLFSLYGCRPTCSGVDSGHGTSWLFTSSPQTAASAQLGTLYFSSTPSSPDALLAGVTLPLAYTASHALNAAIGVRVAASQYQLPPAVLVPAQNAGASAYLFSGPREPASGAEVDGSAVSHLVPLLRFSSNGTHLRKHTYAVDEGRPGTVNGTPAFFRNCGRGSNPACEPADSSVQYNLDVVEGYVWRAHTPEGVLRAQPADTKKLYRYYNSTTRSWALIVEGEETKYVGDVVSNGLVFAGFSAPNETSYGKSLLGYVYPNVDADADGLIDGLELTLGLDPRVADSDCDGDPDGEEYPLAGAPVSDPFDDPNRCAAAAIVPLLDDDD